MGLKVFERLQLDLLNLLRIFGCEVDCVLLPVVVEGLELFEERGIQAGAAVGDGLLATGEERLDTDGCSRDGQDVEGDASERWVGSRMLLIRAGDVLARRAQI